MPFNHVEYSNAYSYFVGERVRAESNNETNLSIEARLLGATQQVETVTE